MTPAKIYPFIGLLYYIGRNMKSSRILIISFLVLLLVALYYFFGTPMSTVPGWHTVVYPPYYPWVLTGIMTLFFGTIGYWLYIKRISRLNRMLFIVYAVMTTLIYLFIKFPNLPLAFVKDNDESLTMGARAIVLLLPVANLALIVTQLLLVCYIGGIILLKNRKRTQS